MRKSGTGGQDFKRLLTAGRHSSLTADAPIGRPCNRYQASCYRDFSREQMRGFLDFLRQKPTSLFILLGWSSISVASLTMQSMYQVLGARMEVL
jgi:hypothetical protein